MPDETPSNPLPDLFAGVSGDAPDKVTTSIDGDKRQRNRNKQHEYRQSTPEELNALFDRMRKAGTYSDHWETVCTGCRKWVTHVYHANPQNTREHFCIDCCPADVREMVLAAQAKRAATASAGDDVARMYGDQPASEPPLPDGVTRAEDIGLPEQ